MDVGDDENGWLRQSQLSFATLEGSHSALPEARYAISSHGMELQPIKEQVVAKPDDAQLSAPLVMIL